MTPQQIIAIIESRMPGQLLAAHGADKHPRVHVEAGAWRTLAELLYHEPQLRFDWLACLSGVDYVAQDKLAVVYDLWSTQWKHRLAVKVFCPRQQPHVPSVCDLWRAADWHEREAYDLLGIIFDGHPDLRRILCADDWEGHPLRKDYVFPAEYHGIPATAPAVPPARS
jgi:NADH-quinone oxidoreductase subunit C